MSSLLKDIAKVIERAKTQAANVKPQEFTLTEEIGQHTQNRLFCGDNIHLIKAMTMDPKWKGKIQLIYLDPPFFSKTDYDAVLSTEGDKVKHLAYNDRWKHGMYEYLRQLTARLILMKDLLSDEGLLFLHLDWHAVHYAKVVMDEIFGEQNFVNEIIWTYKSGGSTKRRFSRKHDNILVYSKTSKYMFHALKEKSYNRGFKPYHFKGVQEYRDEVGWYTMVNMKDVWNIDMVGRTSAERTGYATQKPEALLERIIDCCTNENDICADFFCGSGTLPAVAVRKGRRFVACDNGSLAVENTIGRIAAQRGRLKVYSQKPLEDALVKSLRPRFEASLHAEVRDIVSSPQKILQISLESVKERRLEQEMNEQSAAQIRKIEKEKPLDLVQAWSIDYNFDGKVFRPKEIYLRRNGKLQTTSEKMIDALEAQHLDHIVIKIVDIMGNVSFQRLDEITFFD